MSDLTKYESMEIEYYKSKGIFYTGGPAKKIRMTGSNIREFEDKRGFYRIVPGDHLRFRYEILNELGSGSFGSVVKALDHKKQRNVAIKILRRFRNSDYYDDEQRIMKLLSQTVKDKHNIVRLIKSFPFRDHTCLVMECLGQNLKHHLIQKGRCSIDLARDVCRDILKALRFLHERKIIHGDVEPSNIVFMGPNSTRVKLIDFGCSSFLTKELAVYMQTRAYRAPEVALRLRYTRAIDMWGLATTIYEVYTGQPLFRAFNEQDLIVQMVEVMGEPSASSLSTWKKFSVHYLKYFLATGQLRCSLSTRSDIKVLGRYGGEAHSRSIDKIIGDNENPKFVNFLRKCLLWDARKRISAKQGLQHEWISEGHIQKAIWIQIKIN